MALQLALEVPSEEVPALSATDGGSGPTPSNSPKTNKSRTTTSRPGRVSRQRTQAAQFQPGVAWRLDAETIERGRRGLAEARRALDQARGVSDLAA